MNKRSFSYRIYKLYVNQNYKRARELIQIKLNKKENAKDHWLLCSLATTYYEERNYKRAFTIIKKAYKIAPKCPLVLFNYAGTLDMLEMDDEAIKIWKGLIKRGIRNLAYGECGEGLKEAKGLVLDCYYRLGLAYRDLNDDKTANFYLKRHLMNRYPGNGSIYSMKEVKSKLKSPK